jgi:hypothetical protein
MAMAAMRQSNDNALSQRARRGHGEEYLIVSAAALFFSMISVLSVAGFF